jgi:hypothetical protein
MDAGAGVAVIAVGAVGSTAAKAGETFTTTALIKRAATKKLLSEVSRLIARV